MFQKNLFFLISADQILKIALGSGPSLCHKKANVVSLNNFCWNKESDLIRFVRFIILSHVCEATSFVVCMFLLQD